MAKKDREKNKTKSKSKNESAASKREAHDIAPPASTAPLPTTKGITGNPPTPSGPFSSPLPNPAPRSLQSSPSYIAQRSLKRKRDAEGAKHVPSFSPTTGGLNGLANIAKKVNSHVNFNEGNANAEEKEDAKHEDDTSDDEAEDEHGVNTTTTIEDSVTGVKEAAQEDKEDSDDEGKCSESTSTSGSSSTSSACSSSSSSEDSEAEEAAPPTNELIESGSETEAESEEPESPSKRLKRKHPDKPETSVATRNPPSPELVAQFHNSPDTSVATRNPPPPELEGQFKFTNSITGSNIYRYPKVVLDTLEELEGIIPNTVIRFTEETPSDMRGKFAKKHGDGNEDTKRMLVVLEGAKHMIGHLGKVRLGADGKVSEEDQKEELMKKELMRIARERGHEVEVLREQVKALREEVTGLEEKGKRKRKSSS